MENVIVKIRKFLCKNQKVLLFTHEKNCNEKRYNLVDTKNGMISIDSIAEINKTFSQIKSEVANKNVDFDLLKKVYVCGELIDFSKRCKENEEDCKKYQEQLEAYEFINFSKEEEIEKLKKEIENLKKEKS